MKRKTLIIIGMVILLAVITFGVVYATTTNAANQVMRQFDLGNKYLSEGKYEEAILAFEKVVKIDPKNVEARIGLARAYVKVNRIKEAETLIVATFEITKTRPEPYILLSDIYMQQDNSSKAEEILKQAVDNCPKEPDIYLKLSNYYIEQGRIDEAIQILNDGFKKTNEESLKTKLDDLKNNSGNSNTNSNGNNNTDDTNNGNGKENALPGNTNTKEQVVNDEKYIPIIPGIKIRLASQEDIDSVKHSPDGHVYVSAVEMIADLDQIDPDIISKAVLILPDWQSKPITDQDISKGIQNVQGVLHNDKDNLKNYMNLLNRSNYILPVEEEGNCYAGVFIFDKNVKLIGHFIAKEPIKIAKTANKNDKVNKSKGTDSVNKSKNNEYIQIAEGVEMRIGSADTVEQAKKANKDTISVIERRIKTQQLQPASLKEKAFYCVTHFQNTPIEEGTINDLATNFINNINAENFKISTFYDGYSIIFKEGPTYGTIILFDDKKHMIAHYENKEPFIIESKGEE